MQHNYIPEDCSDSHAMMDTPDTLQPAAEEVHASPPSETDNQTIVTNETNAAIQTETTPQLVTATDSVNGVRQAPSESPQPHQPSIASHPKVGILTNDCVYRLLAQSIGTITLDCGYHEAHQASLDVLSDVCCDYVKRISSMLRLAVDTQDWRDPECDFVDSLERVFHEINVPSAANLHQFLCKMEAIKKHDRRSS